MSKLGPHVIRPTADALEWAKAAPVVKALDDLTALRQSPKASVRIFRRYFPDQNLDRGGARAVDEVLAALGDAPATHVEVYNETAQRLGQGLEQYVDFTANALRRLRERRPDLVLVAYCFSTGNPEADDWAYLRQHEYGGATVIGLHEYWGYQGLTGWNALRYRKVHEWTQGDHPVFLVTECGRDRVEGGHGGWKADGLTEDQYAAELWAYEAELLKDPYVIAATPFTGGPTPDWAMFDTDPISGRMAAVATPLPPPEVPTVPDIVLSVPTSTVLAHPANYQPGPRARTLGVVVHTTRGGASSLAAEYAGTIAWFQNPAAGVSAHLVVGPASVARCVHDADVAWHARAANATHLGIEIAQPTAATPITAFQYRAAAEACRLWAQQHGFPLARVMSQTVPGLVGHEDTESGKLDGKTDPGPQFDWAKFIALCKGGTVPDTEAQLRDQAYALGTQLAALGPKFQAVGCPQTAEYVRNQGQAIERTMVIQKGEK